MHRYRYLWIGLGAIVWIGLLQWLIAHRNDCPSPWSIRSLFQRGPPPPLSVTYAGASTLLIHDGTRGILIDGFFSRPASIAGIIQPLPAQIGAALQKLAVTETSQARTIELLAVIVNHSHYDHAMDSPTVAARTNAFLVGSPSTKKVAEGANFPADRFRDIPENGTGHFCFGNFGITTIKSDHLRLAGVIPIAGTITQPVMPPASADDYKEGGTYSIVVKYRNDRAMLVQASAGFVAGALAEQRADVAFVAVGGFGGASNIPNRQPYWDNVVAAVQAKRIYLIHWDDLTAQVDWTGGAQEPLVEAFTQGAIDFMLGKADAQHSVTKLKLLDPTDPFPP